MACLCKWKIGDIADRSEVTQQMGDAGVMAA